MQKPDSFLTKIFLWVEHTIVVRLVPQNNTGFLFKWLFKTPLLFYKLGLPLFSHIILLLTTTGRKSGKPRRTPLEYQREEGGDGLVIMAGWGGNTDWVRNIQHNPRVHVQVGRKHFDALAEPLTEEEVARLMLRAVQLNPASIRIWSRWAGEELDGSLEGMRRAAKFFPCYRLNPISEENA